MKMIKVTNRAGRWVHVRIGMGQSLRLGPRATSAELPAHCLNAPELRALAAKGVLSVLEMELDRETASETSDEADRSSSGSGTEPQDPKDNPDA